MHGARQRSFEIIVKMGDREDKVYKAKLAEQAERYDGNFLRLFFPANRWLLVSKPFLHAPSLLLV